MFLKVRFTLSSTFFFLLYIFVLHVLLRQSERRQEVSQQAYQAGEDTRGNFCSSVNRRSRSGSSTATYPSLINRPYTAEGRHTAEVKEKKQEAFLAASLTLLSWEKKKRKSSIIHLWMRVKHSFEEYFNQDNNQKSYLMDYLMENAWKPQRWTALEQNNPIWYVYCFPSWFCLVAHQR